MELPSVISIQPNDGFAILLPQEAKTFDVIFKPSTATHYNLTLVIKTSLVMVYKITVKGVGVQPPVCISHSLLRLASACPGDIISQDVMVTNTSKQVGTNG